MVLLFWVDFDDFLSLGNLVYFMAILGILVFVVYFTCFEWFSVTLVYVGVLMVFVGFLMFDDYLVYFACFAGYFAGFWVFIWYLLHFGCFCCYFNVCLGFVIGLPYLAILVVTWVIWCFGCLLTVFC